MGAAPEAFIDVLEIRRHHGASQTVMSASIEYPDESCRSIDMQDTAAQPEHDHYWQRPLTGLLSDLYAGEQGLDDGGARARQARYGPNSLKPRGERAAILEFLSHFRNPLVLVLLAASVVAAFLGDIRSFAVISVIVLLSVVLDFVQEYRAGQAAERLRSKVAVRARVLRGGRAREIPIAELVSGDIVTLSAGGIVPADGRLMEARDFFINQSLLTGESYPVEKHAAEADAAGSLNRSRLRCW
jgi:Mg2+-importing ATPase